MEKYAKAVVAVLVPALASAGYAVDWITPEVCSALVTVLTPALVYAVPNK